MLHGKIEKLAIEFDSRLLKLGAILHDAGKTVHPAELFGPGSQHEEAGQELLVNLGVPADIARCCVSHSQWKKMDSSLEELTVALADKLWKGKRHGELEEEVIDGLAERSGIDRWTLFIEFDSTFEEIAEGGDDRLMRSNDYCS